MTGREYERASILADLLLELELRYDAWREGGLDALYDDLGARDFSAAAASPSTASPGRHR